MDDVIRLIFWLVANLRKLRRNENFKTKQIRHNILICHKAGGENRNCV